MRRYFFSTLVFLFALCLCNFSGVFGQDTYSSEKVIVRFNSQVDPGQKEQLRKQFKMEAPASLDPSTEVWEKMSQEKISRLQKIAEKNPNIKYIEPDYAYSANELTNDPDIVLQWGLNNIGEQNGTPGADIGMAMAWDYGIGSKAVVTGVIDTGLDYTHEDLAENVWQNLAEDADKDGHTLEWIDGVWQLDPGDLDGIDNDNNGYKDDLIGWDFVNNDNNPFDDNGHGTHVAGIIAAKGNNGIGISGVCQVGSIMVLKAFDSEGEGGLSTILPALQYAHMMEANLTNNSWGGESYSQALLDEILDHEAAGRLVVAAAGNQGKDIDADPVYPAAYSVENILSVAATNRADGLATFSNFAETNVDLGAPGTGIYSTLPGNMYGYKSGTSMAAPFVSGAIGFLISTYPGMEFQQVKEMLLSGAEQVPGLQGKCASRGRLQVLRSAIFCSGNCTDWASLSAGYVVVDLVDAGPSIWAATTAGLLELDKINCTLTAYTAANSPLPDNEVSALAWDKSGNVWVGSDKSLLKISGSNWTIYDHANSDMPKGTITSIDTDDEGGVWIGFQKKGAAYFDGATWNTYKAGRNGLPNKKVRSLAVAPDGKVLVGTKKGLGVLDENGWSSYNTHNSEIPSKKINHVSVSESGDWWVSVERAITKYDGASWQVYKDNDLQIQSEKIYTSASKNSDHAWMGTGDGLLRWDGKNSALYHTHNSKVPQNVVKAICVDDAKNIWVGTDNGIDFIMEKPQASFSISNSICLNTPIEMKTTALGANAMDWYIDNAWASNHNSLSHSFLTTGTHEVKLVVFNGSESDTAIQYIIIAPNPTVDLGPDSVACAKAVYLSAGNKGLNHQWFDGRGNLVGADLEYQVNASGTYIATVINGCGVTTSDTIAVTLGGDCVWPGDVNADGRTDMMDFMCLGVAHGATGSVRTNATNNWTSESSADWEGAFGPDYVLAPGVNFKHTDCNGDGQADLNTDMEVLKSRMQPTILPKITPNTSGIRAGLSFKGMTRISDNQVEMSFGIYLEDPEDGDLVDQVRGLSAIVQINAAIEGEPSLSTTSSWLEDPAMISEYYEASNQVEIGIISTNANPGTGTGEVARIDVVISIDDIQESSLLQSFQSFSASMEEVVIIDKDGNPIALEAVVEGQEIITGDNLVEAYKRGRRSFFSEESFKVHPNPATDRVWISFYAPDRTPAHLQILDGMGRVHLQRTIQIMEGENNIPVSLMGLPSGMYIIRLITEGRAQTAKLLVE